MPVKSASGHTARPDGVVLAIPAHRTTRHLILPTVGLLAALVLLTLLNAHVHPFGGDRTPVLSDPLALRVRYERTLVADAKYHLGLQPRVVSVWHWRISIQPENQDPQDAFNDAMHVGNMAFDQPAVLADLWRVRLSYQRLGRIARLYQQAHIAYTPDYSQVQTWLDNIDADLDAILHATDAAMTRATDSCQPLVRRSETDHASICRKARAGPVLALSFAPTGR